MKPILRTGSKGEAVRELQTKLIELGYNLGSYGADGSFGNATDTAVKSFQRKYGLTVDGIVGQATWDKLSELLKAPTNDNYKETLIEIKTLVDKALGE